LVGFAPGLAGTGGFGAILAVAAEAFAAGCAGPGLAGTCGASFIGWNSENFIRINPFILPVFSYLLLF
jgi:hypothetical protein